MDMSTTVKNTLFMVGQVNFLGFLIKIFPFVIELDLCNDTSPGNLIAPQVEQRFMLN